MILENISEFWEYRIKHCADLQAYKSSVVNNIWMVQLYIRTKLNAHRIAYSVEVSTLLLPKIVNMLDTEY
jgi:hypothetical protein